MPKSGFICGKNKLITIISSPPGVGNSINLVKRLPIVIESLKSKIE